MSRTKELKTQPENNINMFELFSLFSPEGKTKYTETLLRIMKKTPNLDEHCEEIRARLSNEFGWDSKMLGEMPKLQLVFFYRLIDSMFNFDDLKTFQKFCEFNERGLVKQNDVSKYNSIDDIASAVSLAEMIASTKEMEKQIKVIFENDEWLLLRPLTFHSSKKYGSNTKWCTTQENNPDYFTKYANKGVLIYCINKKSGYKVASFCSLDKNDPEFSFWNQKDNRVDSLDTELTDELRKVIYNESKGKGAKTNRFILDDEERIKEDKVLSKYGYKSGSYTDASEPVPSEERVSRIRRAIERVNDEVEETVESEQPQMEEQMPEIQMETVQRELLSGIRSLREEIGNINNVMGERQ